MARALGLTRLRSIPHGLAGYRQGRKGRPLRVPALCSRPDLWRRGWALGVKDRDRHEISREK